MTCHDVWICPNPIKAAEKEREKRLGELVLFARCLGLGNSHQIEAVDWNYCRTSNRPQWVKECCTLRRRCNEDVINGVVSHDSPIQLHSALFLFRLICFSRLDSCWHSSARCLSKQIVFYVSDQEREIEIEEGGGLTSLWNSFHGVNSNREHSWEIGKQRGCNQSNLFRGVSAVIDVVGISAVMEGVAWDCATGTVELEYVSVVEFGPPVLLFYVQSRVLIEQYWKKKK